MRGHDQGQVRRGWLADCVLVDRDVSGVLQRHERLSVIVNGRVHKAGRGSMLIIRVGRKSGRSGRGLVGEGLVV
jgi:hypothetical protein